MTHFERIKNMNIDELTKFFEALRDCDGMCGSECICYDKKQNNCVFIYTREYLESEDTEKGGRCR